MIQTLTRLAALATCLLLTLAVPPLARAAATTAAEADRPGGYAIPIGGALAYDNDEVWSRLVALAGGERARYAVIGLASGDPARAAARVVEALRGQGATADYFAIPADLDAASPEDAAQLARRMEDYTAVYFTGGAQERITAALQPEGRPTALLQAIRAIHQRGGVVAGSSAGAAIMSEVMFRDAQDVIAVMQGGLRDGHEVDRGLGFVGPGLFVDQHFLRRGRLGRMLAVMQARGIPLGIGVDEDSGAIIHAGMVEVIGRRGVLVADLGQATHDAALGAFNIAGARLHYLERGDRFDLARREVIPAPWKLSAQRLDPAASDFEPYHRSGAFYPDLIGEGAVLAAMARLLDSPARSISGLAFGAQTEGQAGPGFEFRFGKGERTLGWLATDRGGEAYTLTNVYLDVTPVRMARPLYTPWSGSP